MSQFLGEWQRWWTPRWLVTHEMLCQILSAVKIDGQVQPVPACHSVAVQVRRRPSVGPELLDAWFSLKRSATEHSWTSPGAVTAELTRGPAVMSRLYKVTQRQYGKVHYSWIRGKHVCGSCAGQMAHRRERHVLQATINSEIFFSGEEHGRSECLTSPRISALYLLYGSLLKKNIYVVCSHQAVYFMSLLCLSILRNTLDAVDWIGYKLVQPRDTRQLSYESSIAVVLKRYAAICLPLQAIYVEAAHMHLIKMTARKSMHVVSENTTHTFVL